MIKKIAKPFSGMVLTILISGGVLAAGELPEFDVPITKDTISGIVESRQGPEAGVWVIAQTDELERRFIKIVVTDDKGRFVIPELPAAKYSVWVRGYGLIDSTQRIVSPGQRLHLQATVAPSPAAAAEYYPANYWYSLIEPPKKTAFPGTGHTGNGIAETARTQQDWLALLKDGCVLCHQLGGKWTRELTNNSIEGWTERIAKARPLGDRTVGNQGPGMASFMHITMADYGFRKGIEMFADWTKRIEGGEIPESIPERPQGKERNLVLTLWDWGNGRFMHDIISTDRRNPQVNSNGPVVGVASKHGYFEVFNPNTMAVTEVPFPTGKEPHDFESSYPHTVMMDEKRRVWDADLAGRFWPIPNEWPDQPDFCTNAESNKFAKYFPLPGKEDRAIYRYDINTKKTHRIQNCYGGHHLQFGYDEDNTLYFSGDADVIGWIKTKVWDDTQDPVTSQGWCPLVLNTDGKTTKGYAIDPNRNNWTQPGESLDPTKDTRVSVERFLYGIDVNPNDNSVWAVGFMPSVPSAIYRLDPGVNPPQTCVTEVYQPPKRKDGSYSAFGARGISIDTEGVAWISFNDGHLGKFDRRKCRVFDGPSATGQQCSEGWKIYTTPGPSFKGVDSIEGNTDYLYQSWVDRHDVFQLGKNIPLVNGAMSDSLIAFLPEREEFLRFRVPYPMGFYSRWLDGRIDDKDIGWKGRGYWATYSTMANWHIEGNADRKWGPYLVKFQLRTDPLAY